jgi:hypothetical protein
MWEYYAVRWANGLISRRLDADSVDQAVTELAALSAEELQTLIDEGRFDLDEDAEFDTSSIRFDPNGSLESERVALCASCVWDRADEHDWEIWAWKAPEVEVLPGAKELLEADEEADPLLAYIGVDVTVHGVSYRVGCCVGLRENEHGSARASGCGVYLGNGPDVWWCDKTDYQELPRSVVEPVRAELDRVARRLWCEVEAIRAE